MSKTYDGRNWYWAKKDGTFFSSDRILAVPASDPIFRAWAEDGTQPSRYPLDEHGNESEAELQYVLDDYGRFASLDRYAAAARYEAEIAGVTVKVGGKDVPVSTRRDDRDGLRDTALAITLGLRPDKAMFKFADGVSRPATNAEMGEAIAAAFGHVQACFDAEATVRKSIASGSAKTTEQVDAAFSALRG